MGATDVVDEFAWTRDVVILDVDFRGVEQAVVDRSSNLVDADESSGILVVLTKELAVEPGIGNRGVVFSNTDEATVVAIFTASAHVVGSNSNTDLTVVNRAASIITVIARWADQTAGPLSCRGNGANHMQILDGCIFDVCKRGAIAIADCPPLVCSIQSDGKRKATAVESAGKAPPIIFFVLANLTP